MHITLRQLQVFDFVARHHSFTRAAEALHLSQPGVSMQVKQLESAVGMALFEQIGKRIDLTDAGRVIERLSRSVSEQLREAEQAMDELKGVEGGRLRISVATTVNYFASRLLSAYCAKHPKVQVSLDVTNRESVIRKLSENATDIVLMGKPPDGLDVDAEPFMDNPLVVIAGPRHPLAAKHRIPLTKLSQETFLIREPGSGTRLAMERFFEEKGITPAASIEMTSNEAIKQSVVAGLGLGVVSAHTIELETQAGHLIVLDVRHFPIRRRWYVAHHRAKRLSAAAKAFKGFVLAQSGEHKASLDTGKASSHQT